MFPPATERFTGERSRLRRYAAPVTAYLLPVVLLPTLSAAAASVEPPRFEEVCFGDFDPGKHHLEVERLKKILTPLRGQQSEITATMRQGRGVCNIFGVFRLKPQWQADGVLRLRLLKQNNLDLHFWNGREGVTLRCYPDRNPRLGPGGWAAYGTTRRVNKPHPETEALWATDEGRYRRSGGGTFDIRWQDDKLVMTRGDLLLLCVPFRGLPKEVFLEGVATVADMEMLRSQPFPLRPVSRPVVRRVERAAELDWKGDLPEGVSLSRLPDGRVELATEKVIHKRYAKHAQAAATICRPGLYEYIFEVEDADPGTGIYLGDEQGEPLYGVGFFEDKRGGGRLLFGLLAPRQQASGRTYARQRQVTPCAGRHQWLRLVLGAGCLRCYTSGDGVYWSEAGPLPAVVTGTCATVGLRCRSDERTRRAIKLRSVEVRRLQALSSLVPQEIIDRVGSLADLKTVDDWQRRAAQSRPSDVPADVWRRACSLRVIQDNLPHQVSQQVLYEMLDEVVAGPADVQLKLRVLDEAGMLVRDPNYQDPGADRLAGERKDAKPPKYLSYYLQLGEQLMRQGHPDPVRTINRAIMRAPGQASGCRPFTEKLIRHQLLWLVQDGRWQDIAELCRWLNYWTGSSRRDFRGRWRGKAGGDALDHLLSWGEAQAALHTDAFPGGLRPAVAADWHHPLIERLSKESYNVLAEFRAAVDANAYGEACQIIATSVSDESSGLLPDAKDPRLLVSLPMTIDGAMRQVPALRAAMQEHFAPLGRLRVEQAIADGDPITVKAVMLRFCGSEAAAEAHRWLGDRALAAGQFAEAQGEYQRGVPTASAVQREQLLPRLRLAGAMMGCDVGEPLTAPVKIGPMLFSARQFEQMVAWARQARRTADANGRPAVTGRCPPPARYDVRRWARFDAGNDPKPAGMPTSGLNCPARRLAVAVTAEQMIVNNQFQQVAFDLTSGRRRWALRRELQESGKHKRKGRFNRGGPRWSLTAMRPVINHGRVFVRRLTEQGPELACIESAKGKLLWNTGSAQPVVSDPLLVGQDLFALGAGESLGGQLSLTLVHFNPETGRPLSRVPLAEFRDRWAGALPCRATVVENKIVATVGGSVLCCESSGRVLWIRRQIWVPPPTDFSEALDWHRQVHNPPPVVDRRVYATQPGVWAVECLELDSGRVIWRRGLPEINSLLGSVGGRLVVETAEGLLALEAASGRTLWRHDAADRLEVRFCGESGGILYARPDQVDDPKSTLQPVLVWVNPQTGRTAAEAAVQTPPRKNRLVGPLVANGGRQWLFFGPGEESAVWEITELVPTSP